MKLKPCVDCALPVLELEGQFEKLDLLYFHGPIRPRESVGWWHTLCLAGSDMAALWYAGRLSSLRDIRGYQQIAEDSNWTVVRDPHSGETVALGRSGQLLDLSRGTRVQAHKVEGGYIYPKIEEEFHFELDDSKLVRAIQDGLLKSGTYPLRSVLDGMGIASKMLYPEALERGLFRLKKGLQREWDQRFASARVEYGVFVPTELEPHVGPFVR